MTGRPFQQFYDDGNTVRECVARFGFSTQSWHAAVNRGAVIPRPIAMPVDVLCAAGTPRSRGHLKARLFRLALKQNRCEACGIEDWLGAPLSMALHHINGIRDDNRLENLQLLCPNCHSQTENFSGRNSRRGTSI